jgi:PAS domain S-box-containing protein
MNMSTSVDPVALEQQIDDLRQELLDAEELRHAISHGEVDAFVVGPTEDSKRVLMLSGAYARYRQLVEDMAQGAVTVSRSGEIMFANQAFAALLNLAPTDLVRMPLQHYVTAGDRASLAGLLAPRPGQPDIKASLLRGDGSERRVRMALVSASDEFTTLLVTERSEEEDVAGQTLDAIRSGTVDALVVGNESVVMLDSAQRFYHAAVERMQQGVLIVGAEADITYANQRMAALLGIPRAKLTGRSLYKLVVSADLANLRAVLEARHGASAQAEVRMCKADGRIVATLITMSAIADGQKMCLVSDVSLRKRHEATDERTRKFLGMMAHEFRNILGPIRHGVEYLQRVEGLDPECRKMVEMIDRQSTRLVGLVDDLRRINPKE